MIKLDAECRRALHDTLDTVIDKITAGDAYVDFTLCNYCMYVHAKHGRAEDIDFGGSGWDMVASYYDDYSRMDAMSVADKLTQVEMGTTAVMPERENRKTN